MNVLERQFMVHYEGGGLYSSQPHHGRILNPDNDCLALLIYKENIIFLSAVFRVLALFSNAE